MEKTDKLEPVSPSRLRIGVICFAIFWIPLPVVVLLLGQKNSSGDTTNAAMVAAITVGLVQTAFGIFGLVIAGKETFKIVKDSTWRSLPRTVWRVVRTGEYKHP